MAILKTSALMVCFLDTSFERASWQGKEEGRPSLPLSHSVCPARSARDRLALTSCHVFTNLLGTLALSLPQKLCKKSRSLGTKKFSRVEKRWETTHSSSFIYDESCRLKRVSQSAPCVSNYLMEAFEGFNDFSSPSRSWPGIEAVRIC